MMMIMITMTMLIPTVMWEILSKCKLEKRMHLKSSVVFFSRTHYLQEGTLDRSEPKKGVLYYYKSDLNCFGGVGGGLILYSDPG